jgi:putative transposase
MPGMREIHPNGVYHIYSRGTLKMNIFHCPDDYERFLLQMCKYKRKYSVSFRAFVLMPNHIHLLLVEPAWQPGQKVANISRLMHSLLNSHVKYFCKKYGHSGHVFQSVYRSKLIDSPSYYAQIVKYIHENPVKKGLVSKPEYWPYSSLTRNLL